MSYYDREDVGEDIGEDIGAPIAGDPVGDETGAATMDPMEGSTGGVAGTGRGSG